MSRRNAWCAFDFCAWWRVPSPKLRTPVSDFSSVTDANLEPVERLEASGKTFQPWQEAVEETIEVTDFNLAALAAQPMQWPFRLSARQEREPIRDERGLIVGIILRNKARVAGKIDLARGAARSPDFSS